VWHLFVGAPGGLNDINVMQKSPLYLDVTGGRWPPRGTPFTIRMPHAQATLLPCRRNLPALRFSDVAAPQAVHRGADDVQPLPRGHPERRGAAVWRFVEELSCCAPPWALPLCVAADDDLKGHLHFAQHVRGEPT